jgi:hypothetical protein
MPNTHFLQELNSNPFTAFLSLESLEGIAKHETKGETKLKLKVKGKH